ncbi:MAG: TolC family protein [Planctomycetota bacterium]|jgi:outer membrane protein TolC
MRRVRWQRALAVVWVAPALSACSSPFQESDPETILRRRVAEAIERELATLPPEEPLRVTTQPPAEVEVALADRRRELDEIGPAVPFPRGRLDLGPDLSGGEQKEVAANLQSALVSAVRNNLAIQIARLQPAINEAEVVAAEAAFDAVFVGNVDFEKIDEPATIPVLGGVLLGTPFNANERFRFETGLRKRLTSGAEVSLSTDLTRFRNTSPGIELFPDPAYTAAIRFGVAQPLLRGFGTRVNTASIRLSRNLERRSVQQLRSDLLRLLADTESAYWDLVFAWQNLAIQEWLLEVGIQVRDVMERRREFDTKLAEYSDAVARVEQRKGNVIRARRAIRAASDALKALVNDPQLTVGSEAILVPTDQTVESPIRYNVREAILIGVAERPEIQQAILGINDATIRQELADNARLPLLNLSAQMAYFGMDDVSGEAYDELFEGDFIEYLLGLSFEWPLGNRAAEAGYRRARLERSAAVVGYQQAVQEVVLDVKAALRDCITNHELIRATRSFRIAQAENLRALLVEEETLAGLTPEFLNLKFQRQETLATAQQQETQALVNYNTAVAALYRAMGVSLTMNRIELEIADDEPGSPEPDLASAPGPDHAPSRRID